MLIVIGCCHTSKLLGFARSISKSENFLIEINRGFYYNLLFIHSQIEEFDSHPQYSFSYAVNDASTGDIKVI